VKHEGALIEILGLTEDEQKTMQRGWLASEYRKNDIKGIRTFTVTEGEHKGTYHIGYNDNGDMVVKKYDGETKDYVDGPTVKREQTGREKSRQREADIEKIRKGINPKTGGNIDIKVPPPDSSNEVKKAYGDPRTPDAYRWNVWLKFINDEGGGR